MSHTIVMFGEKFDLVNPETFARAERALREKNVDFPLFKDLFEKKWEEIYCVDDDHKYCDLIICYNFEWDYTRALTLKILNQRLDDYCETTSRRNEPCVNIFIDVPWLLEKIKETKDRTIITRLFEEDIDFSENFDMSFVSLLLKWEEVCGDIFFEFTSQNSSLWNHIQSILDDELADDEVGAKKYLEHYRENVLRACRDTLVRFVGEVPS